MKWMILLLMLPVLAACSTPRQSCINSATRDLAVVNGLIVQTEANLQRGYGLRREAYTSTRVDVCVGSRSYRSSRGFGWNYCAVPQTRYRNVPVTIDRATEQRKLKELQQTRARLVKEARPKLEYCNAKYPAS